MENKTEGSLHLVLATTAAGLAGPGDGFAAFLAQFKASVAADRWDQACAALTYPFRDRYRSTHDIEPAANFASAAQCSANYERLFTKQAMAQLGNAQASVASAGSRDYNLDWAPSHLLAKKGKSG